MLEISPNRKNCAIELTFSGIFIAFDASFVSVLHALCQRQHHVLPDGTHSRWKIATFTYLLFTDFPSKRFLSMCHRECPQTKLLSCDIQCAIQETPPPPFTHPNHKVTTSIFHRQKDVVSFESLAVPTTNMDNAIRSKHVEFGLCRSDFRSLPSIAASPLYMLFGDLYSGSSVLVRNKQLDHWPPGS